ncbi:hypothetical protein K438DRAFT_1754187 [Mycena galopus ATCC 62051]|nr:hypothetical protein K438DRAFT_1754187 [Mycena galopus ATCC 62051]
MAESMDASKPSHRFTFTVRQFEPKDTAQVHALLAEGLLHGRLWCLCRGSSLSRPSGAALCACSTALFFYVRWSIPNFFAEVCAAALKTDLADIAAAYKLSAINRTQFLSRRGTSGFWVAVLENSEEVIGFVGLDCDSSADPSSAELRRMFVSMRHRRQRVGSRLIGVALSHAQRFAPALKTLVLETSELQQGAQYLYEKHGFIIATADWRDSERRGSSIVTSPHPETVGLSVG